jgi:hypothetical protein
MAAVFPASSAHDFNRPPTNSRRHAKFDRFAILAYVLAGISLVFLGTGALGIISAPVTVAVGILALVRLKRASEYHRGRGLVMASILIGLAVTVISLLMILGTHSV